MKRPRGGRVISGVVREKGAGVSKKKEHRKMSNRKFRVLIIIPLVLLVLVAVLLTAVGSIMGSTLDTYLGKGETVIEAPDEVTDWDATYYDISLTNEGDAS